MGRDTFACKDDIRFGNRLDYNMHFLLFTIPRFVGAQFRKCTAQGKVTQQRKEDTWDSDFFLRVIHNNSEVPFWLLITIRLYIIFESAANGQCD
jgi:hypothetical protein